MSCCLAATVIGLAGLVSPKSRRAQPRRCAHFAGYPLWGLGAGAVAEVGAGAGAGAVPRPGRAGVGTVEIVAPVGAEVRVGQGIGSRI